MRKTIRFSFLAATFFLPLSAAADTSIDRGEVIAATYPQYSVSAPTPDVVTICHGFSCQYRAEVWLTGADRAKLAAMLAAGKASASAERRAIAAAGAWFDRRVAPLAGTQHHVAHAGAAYMYDQGQFDCIDASRNTTSLLLVLEELKLLRFHDVDLPVARGFVVAPHVTAVLTEKKTGEKWAVDAWTSGYGQAPEIMPLTVWQSHS